MAPINKAAISGSNPEQFTGKDILSNRISSEQNRLVLNDTIVSMMPERSASFHPLSLGQQAFWFLYQMAPESVAYNIFDTAVIRSHIDIKALHRAWQKIVNRHPILRTAYTIYEGKPFQIIQENLEIYIQITDASNWNKDYLKKQILLETDRSFNLEKELPWRLNIFTISSQEHILLLTMNHIASDSWSYDLLFTELQFWYAAETEQLSAQQVEDFLPKNLPYIDFVRWQSEMLSSPKAEKHWEYWQKQLSGELPILNLPTDRPRPPIQTFQGEIHISQLDKKLIQGLREVARATGTTLYKLTLAAFFVLLYRYTNQEDILVGSPMLGRSGREFKGVVGYFVNPAVLRASISGNLTFTDLLAQVSTQVKAAQKHQDYPFPLLVEELQPQRDPSRSPLFQVSFTWQKQRWCESGKELGLKMEPYPLGHQRGASFDIDVMMMEMGEFLLAGWQYNTDLFDGATIARMTGHFQTLLEAIIANPKQAISELPLLTEQERQQLLVEWNNTEAEYPFDKCIHQLFEEQVQRVPDAVAVVFEGEQLTYRELNARANQLAHYLRLLGVRPEVLIGICVERSFDMIVGILGILKAGGAYVPIDPTYPSDRIAYMLDDSQLPVLLTQEKLVASLPEHQAQVICLDSDWEEISTESDLSPITSVTPENLAYIIYTSGSTGKPKGVLIPHSGLLNLVFWHQRTFEVTSSDRTTQLAGTAFDASVWEMWPYLASGASIYLVKPEFLLCPEELRDWLLSQEITITFVPTPIAEKLLSLQWPSNGALRIMLTGGDKLHQYPSASIPFKIVNNYGPTENTVVTTSGLVTCDRTNNTLPQIGRPINNTQVYILDRYLQPVPIGVPGELHIASVGLARGYLNQPDLTDEKFIPNPFSNQPSDRLYKTGDLARYLPDGNIEYLGRIDNQVKIRGFRIELGEIEAALIQHPAIRETVVVAIENTTDTQQLVAYVVPQTEVSLSISDLRHFLKQQLPDYMIPSAFVTLEYLPLTPNGKLDRRALPAPEIRPELELTFVAPRTPLEEILANVWAEVLGIKQIGINDNFFSLGGHSLLATQIISRIGTNLAVEVPLRHLFESPTIASLAEQIQILLSNEKPVQRPPILPVQRTTEIPLSFAQARLWFLDQLQPESGFYNIPNILRLNGQLNISALENSINEIILRHEALRTNFTTQNGKPVQIIQANIKLKLPIIDLEPLSKEAREIEAKRLVTQWANQPFNLQREPLLRSSLLKLGEQDYIFVLVFHHIIADGWSIEVLERELSTIYTALCNNQTPVLPELPIQYADFAVWQRNWLTGEVFQTQLNYWQEQLKGIPALLELPTDRPRPAIQTYQGTHQSFQLPVELSEAIISLCQRMGVTPFMLLLTAFQTLLYRLSGQDDIVVGTPVANRHYRETEQLIGFFVNTLALRATNLSLNPSFEELVLQVREVTLEAYAHQDLPFEELVEALQPERSLSYSPVFQVMFGVENEPISNFSLPALEVSRLIGETNYAKFDLDLSFQNTNDGFIGQWEYNTDLFDGSTIARMTGYLQTLLSAIVANPKLQIFDLPLLTATQQHQLVIEWNKTQKYYPQDKCIHQLFEKQVELTPDAVAVVFEQEQITYRELNVKANQLAHYLQTLGVKPEVLVGICVERSLEMIIGLLGILKAGGAYVPLDPNYPSERLAFMLEDSSVPVLLTQQKLVEKLPLNSARVISLDSDWEEIASYSEENPSSGVKSNNVAYVIYTSGSTGKPKGVLIEHKSLVNYTKAVITEYEIEKTDRILQFASLNFDISAEEIYTCLSAGATLVLRTDSMLESIEIFLQKCLDWKITVVNLPTAYWHELTARLEVDNLEIPASWRLVAIGGEKALPNRLVEWYQSVGRQVRLMNSYGPTEATINALICDVSPGAVKIVKEVPIGRPIDNTQVYILDLYLQPVPIGVPGELHIAGIGLAREYLNRPDLTAEKFIPNPFSSDPEARLYKTGDRVRYLPDGNIEYLDRIDNQVKIRGFRIELGEIEAVLNSHPAVQEAVVIEREDIPEQKRLVAYLVAKERNKQIEFWPSVGEYPLSDELTYHTMTNDLLRNQSYQHAINALVRDKVVVEIGTGQDAILARFCVEAGAKKVYAIEVSKQAYDRAVALINNLGLSEKIILIHGYSTSVDLPEKADVCVSEVIGTIGGSEGVVPILEDSQRFLKEDGGMIPYRSVTKIAAVSLPEQLRENFAFNKVPAHYVSQVFEYVGRPFDVRLCIKNFPLKNIISNSAVFEDLVFTDDANNEYSLNISLEIEKSGRLDGFLLWLNLYVSPNEVIDNLEREFCWLPVYFPVFYPSLEVYPGDRIEATCTSELSDNKINPDYRIEGKLIGQNGKIIPFAFDSFHHQQPTRRNPFYEVLFPSGQIEENKDSHQLSVQNIRAFISSHLPDYMIPSAFVTLPALPLTPNGKVNRRALPAPEKRSELEESFVAPQTPTQELVASIWGKVLGIEQVGIFNNFFELGGHSLLATQLLSQLRNIYQVELPLSKLFESPTVAEFSSYIDAIYWATQNIESSNTTINGREEVEF